MLPLPSVFSQYCPIPGSIKSHYVPTYLTHRPDVVLNSLSLTKWSSIDFNAQTVVFKVLISCLWSDVRLSETITMGPS